MLLCRRQLEHKDTSGPGQVSHSHVASVRFDRLLDNCEDVAVARPRGVLKNPHWLLLLSRAAARVSRKRKANSIRLTAQRTPNRATGIQV